MPDPAPPPRRAPRPDPPVVCPGVELDKFVLPETPRRLIHRRGNRQGNKRVCFALGEQSHRRRPVLPVLARPRRLAVRRLVPTRPGNVRVLDSTGVFPDMPCMKRV